jgi:hypothetical protein
MANKIGEPVAVINPAGESYGGTAGKKVGAQIKQELGLHKAATKGRGVANPRSGKYEGSGPDQPKGLSARAAGAEAGKPRFRAPAAKHKKPTKTSGQVGVSRSKKSHYR